MTEEKNFIPIYKRIAKVIKYLILILFMLIILAFGILQIPQVQTKIGQELASYISTKTGYNFRIEKVAIYWFDLATIKNIKIYDRHGELMIDAQEVKADFSIQELTTNPIAIDEAFVYAPHVYLIRNTIDSTLNLDDFIITMRQTFIGKRKKKKKKVKSFIIRQGHIINGYFSYNDNLKSYNPKPEVFDKFHFSFRGLNADIDHFYTHLDTFNIDIRNLYTIEEKTQLHFDSLCADMRLTRNSLSFYNLLSGVDQSLIRGNLRFDYDSIKYMSYFQDSIDITADVKNAEVYSQDLAHFVPELKPYYDRWHLTSDFKGRIKNFDLENMDLRFGKQSHFEGHVGLKGLPNIIETLIDVDLTSSSIDPEDVKQYVGNKFYPTVKKFGTINFNGDFFGFPNNFVAHGNALTGLGELHSDLKFVFEENDEEAKYTGHLKTNNFELGKFLNRKDVGAVSMKGQVEGEGFGVEIAKIKIKAQARKFVFNRYAYKNIDIDALLQQGLFDGVMIVEDPNLHLSANGKVDLRDQKNIFDIFISMDKAYLQKLNFTEDSSFFSGEMDLRFKGLTMDEIQGMSTLKNMQVYYNGHYLDVENFYFLSSKRDSTRKFLVKSNYFDVNIEGEYDFGAITKEMLTIKDELLLLIENNPENTLSYYQEKPTSTPFYANYDIHLKDVGPLLNLYFGDVMISANTTIRGNVQSGKTSIFNMYSEVDSLTYDNFTFYDNIIDVSIAKDSDTSSTLGMVYLNSESQAYKNEKILSHLNFETIIDRDDISFELQSKDFDSDDYGSFSGNIGLLNNATKICLNPSSLMVYDNLWKTEDSTFITIRNKNIQFDSLHFQSDSQQVVVHGMLSQSSIAPLFLKFDNLDLDGIIKLPGELPMKGRLDGEIMVSDIYDNLAVNGSVKIADLFVDEVHFGDMAGKMKWENKAKKLTVDMRLSRQDINHVSLKGHYNYLNKESPLDFVLDIQDSDFKILEPFLLGNANELDGTGKGKVYITGNFPKPSFDGQVAIRNGSFKLPYFNTRYNFDDIIYFSEDNIYFDNLYLFDSLYVNGIDRNGHRGRLSGGLSHNFFNDFVFDLDITLDRTLVLNTSEGQNSLYYGTAVASGNIGIKGPLSDVKISSQQLTTERPTFITLNSSTSEIDGPFNVEGLTFVQPNNAQNQQPKEVEKKTEFGYEMQMSFNITPVAQFKVIYDEEVFEVKKGQGILDMRYNSRGDFSLYNTYTIQEGSYNFKFANLVNKKFVANPGSSITWSGDPYDGKLDVTALYKIQTSLAPIFDSTSVDLSNPDSRKPYPVVLLMNINGKISAPEFTFDIEFEDYPLNMPGRPSGLVSTENYISQFQSDIHNNEQELNRQVFSLLVLQSLAYKNSYSGTGGSVTGSVNELIANQMSAWLSEVDDNLEIDLDLSGMSNEEARAMRMRLTYSILDGRVRITRDGNITSTDNQDDASTLIGEWTVEYLITDDGRVRIKAYNKTNQNSASASYYSDNSQVYGASVVFSKDFDSVGEFFESKKKQQEEAEKKEDKKTTTDKKEDGTKEEEPALEDEE